MYGRRRRTEKMRQRERERERERKRAFIKKLGDGAKLEREVG